MRSKYALTEEEKRTLAEEDMCEEMSSEQRQLFHKLPEEERLLRIKEYQNKESLYEEHLERKCQETRLIYERTKMEKAQQAREKHAVNEQARLEQVRLNKRTRRTAARKRKRALKRTEKTSSLS